jgi:hypothetical protein
LTKKSTFDQLTDCQREFAITKRSNINSYLPCDGDKEPITHKERSEMAETMLSLNEGGDPPQDRSFITYSGHKPRVKINPQK